MSKSILKTYIPFLKLDGYSTTRGRNICLRRVHDLGHPDRPRGQKTRASKCITRQCNSSDSVVNRPHGLGVDPVDLSVFQNHSLK